MRPFPPPSDGNHQIMVTDRRLRALYLEQRHVSEEGAHHFGHLPGGWFQRGGEVDVGAGLWGDTISGLENRVTGSGALNNNSSRMTRS